MAVPVAQKGKRFLSWLQNEGSVHESIATEMYERMKCKRCTINAERTFTIPLPFFAAFGASHNDELIDVFVGEDAPGTKGRLSLFYARPTFKRDLEVETAAMENAPRRYQVEKGIGADFHPDSTRT